VIADSDTKWSNVAVVADYFGIVELVEKIKPVGKWVEWLDLPYEKEVSAMKMILADKALVEIAQFPNGLQIFKEGKIIQWGGKCLELDLKGRDPVWIPTVMGKVPLGAIAVEGKGGESMYIGRKFFNADGSLQEMVQIWSTGDKIEVPNEIKSTEYTEPTLISTGYVNEEGIFGITFCSSVDDICDAQKMCDVKLETFSNAEFEVLCALLT